MERKIVRTKEEFNEKYKEYIEEGYETQGMMIDTPAVVMYMDSIFPDFLKIPGFKYTQIKTKFGMSRFYSNTAEIMPFLGNTIDHAVEERINFLLRVENEIDKRLATLKPELNGKETEFNSIH
jgi:hypothetical protein